jgi:protein transport protein DSL1/ZW10
MAFPIPEHLPKQSLAKPQDISSEIVAKIGETSNKALNSALAATWLHELDETIRATKVCN